MNDPYVYPDTNILINLAGLKKQNDLDKYENNLASLALADLLQNPIEIKSCMDLLLIHKRIFGEIYPFAGQVRSIDIFKEEPILGGFLLFILLIEKLLKDLKI
ncbi:MAG: hypothetical protein LKJ88_08340 [Bacilli bacterium]|jgi:cell filamentation protein|nr:hypothetical protein [Bacilli bacterium]